MKRIILLLTLLFFLLAGCSLQKQTAVNLEEYSGDDNGSWYSLSVAQLADDTFYYIDQQSGGLYAADCALNTPAKLADGPINLFAVTEDRIICMDESGTLRIYGKDAEPQSTLAWKPRRYMRKPLGFGYLPLGDCVVCDDCIIYIDESSRLVRMDWSGEKKLLSAEETLYMVPYGHSIIHVVKNGRILDSNTLMITDTDGDKSIEVFRRYIYDFKVYEIWVYYIHDYSLYRFDMASEQHEDVMKDSGIFEFAILDDRIVCCRQNDLIACGLDGSAITTIESGGGAQLLGGGCGILVYHNDAGDIGIYHIGTGEVYKADARGACLNCVMADGFIYMVLENGKGTTAYSAIFGLTGEKLNELEA